MPELSVTRRAVLYGTAASLTGPASPRGAEAQPAVAAPAPTPPPVAATVDFGITVNGEPLLVTAEPTLLGRLGNYLGLADLPAPLPLVAHCDKTEMVAPPLPLPPTNPGGHRRSD